MDCPIDLPLNLPFNSKASSVLHIDLNSCFAGIEQQANPLIRGKPVAVAAYVTDSGCIVAPSIEAKRLGIKTGMRVREGKLLCRDLIVLPADPNKYRFIHQQLKKLLESYTDDVHAKSIDEFVVNLEGSPAYKQGMRVVGQEIKGRIREEIGEYLTVSIGIAPSRFLAKTAAGLRKPDGLEQIDHANFLDVYRNLKLVDLCGIDVRNSARLNSVGVFTVMDMYRAPIERLRAAFHSILGYHWYYRLRGWEVDDIEFGRKSFGNSYSLPAPLATIEELTPILAKLVHKMSRRMRSDGYKARGVHLAVVYRDGGHWHEGVTTHRLLFDERDIYKEALRLLHRSPYKGTAVRNLAVSCFNLIAEAAPQLELFDDSTRKASLVEAIDAVNTRYGDYVLTPGIMIGTEGNVPDRISWSAV